MNRPRPKFSVGEIVDLINLQGQVILEDREITKRLWINIPQQGLRCWAYTLANDPDEAVAKAQGAHFFARREEYLRKKPPRQSVQDFMKRLKQNERAAIKSA